MMQLMSALAMLAARLAAVPMVGAATAASRSGVRPAGQRAGPGTRRSRPVDRQREGVRVPSGDGELAHVTLADRPAIPARPAIVVPAARLIHLSAWLRQAAGVFCSV